MLKNNIPDWFTPDKYDWLEDATDKKLFLEWTMRAQYLNNGSMFSQLEKRIADIESYTGDKDKDFYLDLDIKEAISNQTSNSYSTNDVEYMAIKKSNGLIEELLLKRYNFSEGFDLKALFSPNKSFFVAHKMQDHPEYRIPHTKYFSPLILDDVDHYGLGYDLDYDDVPDPLKKYVAISSLLEDKSSLFYKINTSVSDAELKRDFKKLLLTLREQFPYEGSKSQEKTPFERMREKPYIQVLDILIIKKVEKKPIMNSPEFTRDFLAS